MLVLQMKTSLCSAFGKYEFDDYRLFTKVISVLVVCFSSVQHVPGQHKRRQVFKCTLVLRQLNVCRMRSFLSFLSKILSQYFSVHWYREKTYIVSQNSVLLLRNSVGVSAMSTVKQRRCIFKQRLDMRFQSKLSFNLKLF